MGGRQLKIADGRFKSKLNSCGVIKAALKELQGCPDIQGNKCLGYSTANDDEPIEQCKNCELNSAYEEYGGSLDDINWADEEVEKIIRGRENVPKNDDFAWWSCHYEYKNKKTNKSYRLEELQNKYKLGFAEKKLWNIIERYYIAEEVYVIELKNLLTITESI